MTELVDYKTGEIQVFNPNDAMKTMAIAEVAEKYYKKAKDLDGLHNAIETIWTVRRDFVVWWDAQDHPEGRPEKNSNRSVTVSEELKKFNLSPMVVSRWRQKVGDGEKLGKMIETQYVKAAKIINPEALADKHTGDEESYTPEQYIESARKVMGSIDLDPASNLMAQETVKASEFYTIDDDGLSFEWAGNVWLNPPYTSRLIDKFIAKLVDHYQAGDIKQAVLLTNNNTDTQWFLAAARAASRICFTTGRINFLKRDGTTSSPTNGQAFFYFGESPESFAAEFLVYGLVMKRDV